MVFIYARKKSTFVTMKHCQLWPCEGRSRVEVELGIGQCNYEDTNLPTKSFL